MEKEITKMRVLNQPLLDSLNVEQARKENRQNLDDLGGVEGLMKLIGVNTSTGLSHEQVTDLRAKFGTNEFPEAPLDSYLSLLIEALSDTTLLILIAAATVSLVIGVITEPDHGWIEGAAIFIAIFLVANISAGNDYSKQYQFRALEKSSADDERSSVLRNGFVERINPRDIVVGDILVLQAGEMIPADSIILDKVTILANESSLTGEPDELKKHPDRDCFLLSSCLITEGEDCKALVIGIGTHSQWGKIKANLVSEAVNTPLQDKLEDMAGMIGNIGTFFAIATFIVLVINIFVKDGGKDVATGIINAFIIAVTIIVVAIPEGLPLAVTIALAYSTKKMYQDQCLIRVLAACETMGNATNICSDKTGTLTENRMTVVEGWFADKIYDQDTFPSLSLLSSVQAMIVEHVSVNRSAYLVYKDADGNDLDRPQIIGNKTEGALIFMARGWGYNYETVHAGAYVEGRDHVWSFNSAKKRATAMLFRPDGTVTLYCKGASEWILKDCTHHVNEEGQVVVLTEEKRKSLERHILSMAEKALRTLCLAYRTFSSKNDLPSNYADNPPDSEQLILQCIVGIIDPLRSDVKEAVRIAQQAGVTVRMVTGDNIATACAIARQCGILTSTGLAMEGPTFRAMAPKDVDAILPRLQVLARSSPDDKYLLVTRLNGYGLPRSREEWEKKFAGQEGVSWETHREKLMPGYREEWEATRPEGGQVVGVTGDGTNDAPALKAADVGMAMGITGTKVAQSAADIVILDDKFSSIVKAILWGRSVYDNIRKFLQFQLSVNLVALCLVFISAVSGKAVPLNAVQLLWVNLIMDTMGALALGTEAPTPDLLQRKPYKRSAFLLSRPMIRNLVCQSIFQLILLLILLFQGAELFGIEDSDYCVAYNVKSGGTAWSTTTFQKSATGTFTCGDFRAVCGRPGEQGCLDTVHDLSAFTPNGTALMSTLSAFQGYEDTCLECSQFSYVLTTIIFNTFIFSQIFNEYTARSIGDEWNVFRGVFSNGIFLGVSVVTIGLQIFLVELGGEFLKTTPLTANQWLVSVALGAIGIPVGMLMRFIPVTEDPNTFFDNSAKEAASLALETEQGGAGGKRARSGKIHTEGGNNGGGGDGHESPLQLTPAGL